ncbi:hypothetical protein HanXRQr2_Chr01g0040691 [Helianthus annuus]|uniref:Uncharacterized protein n=1 Tax=Helianthus annuus TaxID=4232 RepID=A0A9K3P5W8_HELAN|nr:hypothetical protein HanXRQr2_Chr01g0040691 [Helianthus annuus]
MMSLHSCLTWSILGRDAPLELRDLARYGTFSRCTSFRDHPGFRECDSFLDKSQSLNCVYVMFKFVMFVEQGCGC